MGVVVEDEPSESIISIKANESTKIPKNFKNPLSLGLFFAVFFKYKYCELSLDKSFASSGMLFVS